LPRLRKSEKELGSSHFGTASDEVAEEAGDFAPTVEWLILEMATLT
jgi:hypothetical protein